MDGLLFPLLATALIGGAATHYLANRRIRKMRAHYAKLSAMTAAAMMDLNLQIQTVEYGAELEQAIEKLREHMEGRFPGSSKALPKLTPELIAQAKRAIAQAREEKARGNAK